MNWVTTNIRLPDDLYMDLKMKAARERKSIAAVIREKLSSHEKDREKTQETRTKKILKQMMEVRKRIAKENPGIDFAKALIEMRYEQ